MPGELSSRCVDVLHHWYDLGNKLQIYFHLAKVVLPWVVTLIYFWKSQDIIFTKIKILHG
jgi:hypothetical protein